MTELTLELICRSYHLGYQQNNKKDFNKGVSFLGEKTILGIRLAILWYSKIRKANVGARLGQQWQGRSFWIQGKDDHNKKGRIKRIIIKQTILRKISEGGAQKRKWSQLREMENDDGPSVCGRQGLVKASRSRWKWLGRTQNKDNRNPTIGIKREKFTWADNVMSSWRFCVRKLPQ
jgi:hypothetical protein